MILLLWKPSIFDLDLPVCDSQYNKDWFVPFGEKTIVDETDNVMYQFTYNICRGYD
jgi:hypothetical protein